MSILGGERIGLLLGRYEKPVTSCIASPSRCSSSEAPSHFLSRRETLPTLDGRFSSVVTKSRNCSLDTRSSTCLARLFAVIQRVLDWESSDLMLFLASRRSAIASWRSG